MGWKEFATAFEMKKGFVVFFNYARNSLFNVIVYHRATVEQPLPNYPLGSLPTKFFTCIVYDERLYEMEFPEQFSEQFVDRLPNPIFLKPGNPPIWFVFWKLVDGKICLYCGWREFAARMSLGKSDIILFHYDGGADFAVKVCRYAKGQVTLSEHMIGENDDLMEMEQQPLWTTKVSEYILSKTKPPYIPAGVVKHHFPRKLEQHDFRLPSGKVCKWSFIWSNREKNEGYLGHGWYKFVVEYGLELNQEVCFFKEGNDGIIHIEVS